MQDVHSEGRRELTHLQKVIKTSHDVQQLVSKIGLDPSSFDSDRYPACHIFHGYSGYALTSAIVALVRHGEDSKENFELFFGSSPAKSAVLNRLYGDALDSTPLLASKAFEKTVTKPQIPQPNSPTEPHALWCNDEPYHEGTGGGDNSNRADSKGISHRTMQTVLLPAVYNLCGRHFITTKPSETKSKACITNGNYSKARRQQAVRTIVNKATTLAGHTGINTTRFPPLPKHMTRSTDPSCNTSLESRVSVAFSSVTGTVCTGAVTDAKPIPKIVPSGAHDPDDSFMTSIF